MTSPKQALQHWLGRHPGVARRYRRLRGLPEPAPRPPRGRLGRGKARTRIVHIALPERSGPSQRSVRMAAPKRLYLPRKLEELGLAGYEPEALSCLLAVLDHAPPGPVWDVGCNVGVYSLLAAATTDRPVVAFEPTPEIAAVARTVALDNVLRIEVREEALSSEPGTAEFFISGTTDTSSTLAEGFRPSTSSLQVTLESVDSLVAAGMPAPVVLKIDTETTEPDVLAGARATLARVRPRILCEVLLSRSEERLTAELEPLGYAWYRIDDELPLQRRDRIEGDPTYQYFMWLFAPQEPDEAFWSSMKQWRRALASCTPSPRSADPVAPQP